MKIRKTQITLAVRGLINPIVLRWQEFDLQSTLIIAGSPRSGTTWFAEIIASTPGAGILFEPLNLKQVPEAKECGCGWRNFRGVDEFWPEGERFLKRILEGKVLNFWTTSHIPLTSVFKVRRLIVKMIGANRMLGWLTQQFPIHKPILIIRHPCAVYLSRIKIGWGVPKLIDTDETRKFLSIYPKFESLISTLTKREEFFAARWAMDQYVPLSLQHPFPFELLSYERLLSFGLEELKRILNIWDLPMPRKIDEILRRPSSKVGSYNGKDSAKQLSRWKSEIDPAIIDRILNVVSAFGLDFYGTDHEPDYDRLYGDNPLRQNC